MNTAIIIFSLAIKAIPFVLHVVLLTILLSNKKRYLSSSFYSLICILSVTIIIETFLSMLSHIDNEALPGYEESHVYCTLLSVVGYYMEPDRGKYAIHCLIDDNESRV
ncbi:unnamed protein product [Cylicocyclus nassatus]|uniref:Uncharacterized protein n=1 Tax=Cylicocyclus nassatus TaxID=53992 RepID=A0AA36M938_CYLNA|nr:unnamed protein product [Cylicocyclus nassatus]